MQRYEEKYGPISPDQRQWLALVGGVITNYATGHTLQTGAAVGVYGTKWNEFKERNDWKSLGDACEHMVEETDKEFADTEINMMQWKLDNQKNSIDESSKEKEALLSSFSYISSKLLSKANGDFESAVILYDHAIVGAGEKLWFEKDSIVAKDLINSNKFKKRIQDEAKSLKNGENKIITFSENLDDSRAQNVAFGKVKFAVEIRKDKGSRVFVTGQARDNYDFSYLPEDSCQYNKQEAIKQANNIAYWLQCMGKLKPYIWGADIVWNFMLENE